MDLGVLGARGASGNPSFGVGGGISLLVGRSRIELGAAYFPPARVAGEAHGTGGDFDLLAGSLSGCHALLTRSIQVSPCLAGELGRLQATGSGSSLEVSAEGTALWVAARAGGLAVWRVGRLGLRVQLDAVVPLIRNRFVIDDVGAVSRPAAVGGRAALGAEVHFD